MLKSAIISIVLGFDIGMDAWLASHPTLTINDIIIVSVSTEAVNLLYTNDSV